MVSQIHLSDEEVRSQIERLYAKGSKFIAPRVVIEKVFQTYIAKQVEQNPEMFV